MTVTESAPSGIRRFVPRDLGLWPVIIALVIIGVGFFLANEAYLSPRNLSNLAMQTATLAVLTLGVMLVLLLGEIDLSVGAVSGITASLMGILSALAGWPAWAAILSALVAGALIGLAQGAWIVAFRAPSFIVTLAGMLVWQGVQLWALSSQNGQLRVADPVITGIASTYLPSPVGWAIGIAVAIVGAGWVIGKRSLGIRAGYQVGALGIDLLKVAVIVLLPIGVVALMESYLGVPVLLVIVLAITLVLAIVTSSTVFGRHIYAVGGNAEAARRTGIPVARVKLAIFVIVAVLAAIGGVLSVARGYSVSVNTGGGNLTLNAIAAAVIGGTSLFGGRGTIVGALLGALVISSVQNGLALIGQTAATQTITTGLILLAAVTLDMTARRSGGAGGAR